MAVAGLIKTVYGSGKPFVRSISHCHSGGGWVDTRMPFASVANFCVLYGTFDGLYDGDVIVPVRVVEGLGVACLPSEVVVRMPLLVMVPHLIAKHLQTVARAHHIGVKLHAAVDNLRQAVAGHVCSMTCPPDDWLFLRPLVSQVNPFGRENYNIFLPVAPAPAATAVPSSGDALPAQCGHPSFPPTLPSEAALADIVMDWTNATSNFVLDEGCCASCGETKLTAEMTDVSLDSPIMDVLYMHTATSVPDVCVPARSQHAVDPVLCANGVNHERRVASLCKTCDHSLRRRKELPRLALANGLWLGHVPPELSELSFAEKLMISRYRHNVCVVTVATGGKKMSANAVVFSQPVAKFQAALPPTHDELSEVLAILFTGPCEPVESDFKRTPLLIRKSYVLRALMWLRDNHSQYTDLIISHENLESYPEAEPPVTWFHQHGDGSAPSECLAINERDDDRGVDDGPCSFAMHGLTADEIHVDSYDTRVADALTYLRNGRHVLGYGHATQPETMFHNSKMYPGMFPWLFPYGYGGFENEQIVRHVPHLTQVRHLMNYHDRRFQEDYYFPFMVYNQEQIRSSSRGGFILTERQGFQHLVDRLLSVDPEALAALAKRGRVEGYARPETDEERRCFEIISIVDLVAGHVPGSNTQKKYQRNEIRSLIIRYGVPVFFITFAPTESRNPLCLYFCGQPADFYDYFPMRSRDDERLRQVVSNPAACARFFNLMVNLFIKHVLRADSDNDGLFRPTETYYGTVEQQGRLTLHLHLLLWIKGSISPQEIRDRCKNNSGEFARDIIEWLEACHQGEFSSGAEEDIGRRVNERGRPDPGAHPRPWWPDPRNALPKPPPQTRDSVVLRQWLQDVRELTDEIVLLCNSHDRTHQKGCRRPPHFQCRGRFPRPLQPFSSVEDDTGAILLKKGEA